MTGDNQGRRLRRLLLLGLAVVAVVWAALNVWGVMRDHDRARAPDREDMAAAQGMKLAPAKAAATTISDAGM